MPSAGGQVENLPHGPFTPEGRRAAEKTLPEIAGRLRFLQKVGLDYLSLDRPTRTLSGGEFQRARLASCLGAGLIGTCYVLDEPTVGLHPRDTRRLVETLEELRDQGNTVIVVEHDADVVARADWLIDLGPGAGREGGRVVAQGTPADVARQPESLTGHYLGRGLRIAHEPSGKVSGKGDRHPPALDHAPPEEQEAGARPSFPSGKGDRHPLSLDHALPEEQQTGASPLFRTASAGSGRRSIDWDRVITLTGARLHNLSNVTLRVPLGTLTCVTGVSGSGKSSLISHTLVPAVRQALERRHPPVGQASQPDTRTAPVGQAFQPDTRTAPVGQAFQPDTRTAAVSRRKRQAGKPDLRSGSGGQPFDALTGLEHLDRLVEIDQSPLGRSERSNPATASGMWDEVRRVFAKTREARLRGYTARRFSFNAREGRCETCRGQGTQRIEMHFLPDLYVTCPACRGGRFNRQTLAVRFAGRNVADVLRLRIDEALEVFEAFPRLRSVLETFEAVGLGYLALGQSSTTLSGGEAQRVKLASELCRQGDERTLFVLDEPTTGLHPADIEKLLGLLQRLVDQGHTVLVVEHQLDVIAAADRVVDLGPEGGRAGGAIVVEGPPDEIARNPHSHTGAALRVRGETP